MANNPDFSVLMAVYFGDHPVQLRDALNSVLINQSVPPTELILIVDGAVSVQLEHEISVWEKNDKVRVFRTSENVGLARALNFGLSHCTFNLIFRMDADDICVPDRFSSQLKTFEMDKSIAILGGQVREFSGNNLLKNRFVPIDHSKIVSFARFRCPFNHPTVMLNLNALGDDFRYNVDIFPEDYITWLAQIKKGKKCLNLDKVLVMMRANSSFLKRRQGLAYAKRELDMLRYARRHGLFTRNVFFINLVLRMSVRILPLGLLKFLYKYILRSSTNRIKLM